MEGSALQTKTYNIMNILEAFNQNGQTLIFLQSGSHSSFMKLEEEYSPGVWGGTIYPKHSIGFYSAEKVAEYPKKTLSIEWVKTLPMAVIENLYAKVKVASRQKIELSALATVIINSDWIKGLFGDGDYPSFSYEQRGQSFSMHREGYNECYKFLTYCEDKTEYEYGVLRRCKEAI